MLFNICINCNKKVYDDSKKFCSEVCETIHKKSLVCKQQFIKRSEQINGGSLLSAGLIEVEFVNLGKVYNIQYGFCAWCRQMFDSFFETSVDHIIPITKGGGHTYENIQLVHKSCNSSKNNSEINKTDPSIYKRLYKIHLNKKIKESKEKWNLLSKEEKIERMHEVVEKILIGV